jgi:hypothetical protein
VSSDLKHTPTLSLSSLQVFLDPLENNGILSKQDIKLLFSNLNDILQVNNVILARLEQRLNEAGSTNNMEVGDIFLEVVRVSASCFSSSSFSSSLFSFFSFVSPNTKSVPKFQYFVSSQNE